VFLDVKCRIFDIYLFVSKSLSGNLKLNYSSDAFLGTADYYVRYRIPYPKVLLGDLIKRSNLPPHGKLLDLASGPGRIAIPLAPHFTKVWANDAEPEMIAAGKREAGKADTKNIEWLLGKAEELELESNSIDLITIGEAFHRVNQNTVSKLALDWLKPGSHIAIIGCYSIFRGKKPWHKTVYDIVYEWTSPGSSNEDETSERRKLREAKQYMHILEENRFTECNNYSFTIQYYWSAESIIGYLYSTSVCSKRVIGDKSDEFEAEIKTALEKINRQDKFSDVIQCGYTLGKKLLS
jgi:ubiquinone/menaquinone biosynthesis C-methylase UbiE